MNKFYLCGLDEAGRGALAGPLVIAAVVMPARFKFEDVAPGVIVRDSKKLSIRQRKIVFNIIRKFAIQINTQVIPAEEINEKGINWANLEGFQRLIININASEYIIDGKWCLPDFGNKAPLVRCVIDADEYIPAVLSAGIVAKLRRDEIMQQLHLHYPIYGWNTNTGHGTKFHLEAIAKYGLCDEHRKQFVETALEKMK